MGLHQTSNFCASKDSEWNENFWIFESLYCTPETNIALYVNRFWIKEEYYEQLCAHIFDNLDEMDQFLKDTIYQNSYKEK